MLVALLAGLFTELAYKFLTTIVDQAIKRASKAVKPS